MSTGRRMVGAVATMAMVLLAGASDADAYVQYHSDSGRTFAWMPACLPLPIVAYPDGLSMMMTIEETTRAGTGAGAAPRSCSWPRRWVDGNRVGHEVPRRSSRPR